MQLFSGEAIWTISEKNKFPIHKKNITEKSLK